MAGNVTRFRWLGHNLTSFSLFGNVINVVDDNQTENPPPAPPVAVDPPSPTLALGVASPPPPPGVAPLPLAVIEAIRGRRGTYLRYVASKVLTDSDVLKHFSRLFVPIEERLLSYLNEVERRKIEELDDDKKPQDIEVEVVDSRGGWYEMVLRKWPSTKNHVILVNKWMKLVNGIGLHKGDKVELWFFRANNRLGVAVNKV